MEYNKKIDGYNITEEISKGTNREENLKDITITYMSDNKVFADSFPYRNVPADKVQKVKDVLFELTLSNLNTERVSGAISFFEILIEVERIIYE